MDEAGKIAYQAYYVKCEGVSLISGAPLPDWDDQAEEIQDAWQAAGEAVAEWVAG